MKKIMILFLCFVMAFSVTTFAENDLGEVSVIIKGEKIEFDVPPQIIEGRTMVPMRKIFETLGARVQWIGEIQLIVATRGSEIIAMEIGKYSLSVTNVMSGETKTTEMDVPPQIVDDRTLVPARAVSEALNMNVQWDNETRTVTIEEILE